LSLSAEAQRKPEASPKAFAATSCGNGRVIAALRAAPAYSYIYAWRTPVLNGRPGSFHASEIAFTFDKAEICDHYSCGVPEAFVLSTLWHCEPSTTAAGLALDAVPMSIVEEIKA
jgi:hypothetical protein